MARTNKNTVQISKLKPQISRYLRAAQKRLRTTVLDRDTPIAVIGPVDPSELHADKSLDVIPAIGKYEDISKISISPIAKKVDSLALLLEERGER